VGCFWEKVENSRGLQGANGIVKTLPSVPAESCYRWHYIIPHRNPKSENWISKFDEIDLWQHPRPLSILHSNAHSRAWS